MNETLHVNESINAELHFDKVYTDFNDSGNTISSRYRELIGKLKEDCEIICDMTYGTKTIIPVLFYVLGFAEKFFNADVKNILYDKTEFEKLPSGASFPKPETCELFDVTSLYYLNSLTSVMEAPDGKTALKRLDTFFAL